jgi:hypothetical protein
MNQLKILKDKNVRRTAKPTNLTDMGTLDDSTTNNNLVSINDPQTQVKEKYEIKYYSDPKLNDEPATAYGSKNLLLKNSEQKQSNDSFESEDASIGVSNDEVAGLKQTADTRTQSNVGKTDWNTGGGGTLVSPKKKTIPVIAES